MDWEIGPKPDTPTERTETDMQKCKTKPRNEEVICDESTIPMRLGNCATINMSPDEDELMERVTKSSNDTMDEFIGSHNQFRLLMEDRKPKTRNMQVTEQWKTTRILLSNDRSDLGEFMGMRSVKRRIKKMNWKRQRKRTKSRMVATMKRRTDVGVCEGTANRRRGKMWYSDEMGVLSRERGVSSRSREAEFRRTLSFLKRSLRKFESE